MKLEDVKKLVSQLTLEEKAGLCSGRDFWNTKSVDRLGVPAVMVTDGPHGLRKQSASADHLGINESVVSVAFPAGCASAASFDVELSNTLGKTLGIEAKANDVSVVLGPAVNIKRSPLCGRNFEYLSEDPLVATKIAASYVRGLQSNNVGTSPKHFLANNQENRRMSSNSQVDERTLREIYLAAFEGIVVDSKPWTVMCSYNRINGTYACENEVFLTDIMRNEWGFDGYVMTDWGAMNDRVKALKAGLELEMPASGGVNDALIIKAVKDGELEECVLDEACTRILNIVYKYYDDKDNQEEYNLEKNHSLSRSLAEQCMVLLKNEGSILPLKKDAKIAFVGKYAKSPRYQGGGSSHINPFKIDNAVDSVTELIPNAKVSYAQGFIDERDKTDETLLREAVELAKNSEVAVIFAGLPDAFESEGYDRQHMGMPNCQNELISEICKVQKNVVVVLHNGSPVEMPWINDVSGVLEAYLGGEAVGSATINVLFGNTNPSGKLPETFPIRLEDTPTYGTYGLDTDDVVYNEGVFVGYRYYTTRNMEVLFPFGHGLSYTTFEISNLKLSSKDIKDTDKLEVTVDVKNTGSVVGREVIQVYVSTVNKRIPRPLRELKAFAKVELQPNETKTVTLTLDKRAFAYWSVDANDWYAETADYTIQVCKNASTVLLEENVHVTTSTVIKRVYTVNSTIGDIKADPRANAIFEEKAGQILRGMQEVFGGTGDVFAENDETKDMMEAMMNFMILRQLYSFVPGVTAEMVQGIVDEMNK